MTPFIFKPSASVRKDLSRSKGFSSIEILSTIALILIMASILLSAITSAREKGLQAKCINNQKNLAAALIMYAADHETFPAELASIKVTPIFSPIAGTHLAYADEDTAGPYIQDYYDHELGLTRCPKISGEISDPSPVYSYGINALVQEVNLSAITEASETILLTDSSNEETVSSVEEVDFRHMNGAIAGYADGHVEWVRLNQLMDAEDEEGGPDSDSDIQGGILFVREGVPPDEDDDDDDDDDEDDDEDDDSDNEHNDRGHGNNDDHDDEDNPGQGGGGHGHDHEDNTEESHDGMDDDELEGGNGHN